MWLQNEDQKRLDNAKKRAERDRQRMERMSQTKTWDKPYDMSALKKQMDEKVARAEKEKQESLDYDRQMNELSQKALEEDKQRQLQARETRKQMAMELRSFDRSKTTTFDINDPNVLKNHATEPDQSMSVSSLQKFEGEDLTYSERIKKQQHSSMEYFHQQIAAKNEQIKKQIQNDRDYAMNQTRVLDNLNQEDQNSDFKRKQKTRSIAEENRKIAAIKAEKLKQLRELDEEMNKREIEYNKNHNILLAEKFQDTRRADGTDRFVPYNFKGFTSDQHQEFAAARIQQMEERKSKKLEEQEEEQRWHELAEEQRKNALQEEIIRNKKKEQMRKEVKEFVHVRNEPNYSNEVSEDFFSQFGTSCR